MKFDYKSYSNHLESENERLNAIIDELEEINENQLTDIFMLNVKINKAIEYAKTTLKFARLEKDFEKEKILLNFLEILGGVKNGM